MSGNTVTPDPGSSPGQAEAQRTTGIYSHALISRCTRVFPLVKAKIRGPYDVRTRLYRLEP